MLDMAGCGEPHFACLVYLVVEVLNVFEDGFSEIFFGIILSGLRLGQNAKVVKVVEFLLTGQQRVSFGVWFFGFGECFHELLLAKNAYNKDLRYKMGMDGRETNVNCLQPGWLIIVFFVDEIISSNYSFSNPFVSNPSFSNPLTKYNNFRV